MCTGGGGGGRSLIDEGVGNGSAASYLPINQSSTLAVAGTVKRRTAAAACCCCCCFAYRNWARKAVVAGAAVGVEDPGAEARERAEIDAL